MTIMLKVMDSPYKNSLDSPSRQLLEELGRLQISSQETFYARLDRESSEREAAHRSALAAAAAEHDRIRRAAEIEREKLQLRIQAERERRDREERKALEDERHALEKERREKAENEVEERRRDLENEQATKAAEKKAADARKAADAAIVEARLAKEKREAEAATKAKEKVEADILTAEAEKRAKEKAVEALKGQNKSESSTALTPINRPLLQQTTQNQSQRVAEFQRYLEIHQKLKGLRKFLTETAKKDASLKTQVGDMRRSIRKCVGQLTEGKNSNRAPVSPDPCSTLSSFPIPLTPPDHD